MIAYSEMRKTVLKGLMDYIGVPVIRGNQTAPAPPYPYGSYNITTLASKNSGTWQQHSDGIDRLMVRSVWSFSFLSADWDESVSLAIKAREWFDRTGHAWLADRGITVQSTTEITNRDNILTVEYERKNGFDVVFYVFHEVESPTGTNGYIESASMTRKMTD